MFCTTDVTTKQSVQVSMWQKSLCCSEANFRPIEVVVTNSVMLVYKISINVIDFGNIAGTDFLGSKPPTKQDVFYHRIVDQNVNS